VLQNLKGIAELSKEKGVEIEEEEGVEDIKNIVYDGSW